MITVQQVSLQLGSRVLLKDANLGIYANQKIGLVGANGSGKTSLFRLILGQLQADKGSVSKTSSCRIGHLAQELPALTISALDYVCQGDEDWWRIQCQIDEALASDEHDQLGDLYVQMQDIDGYTITARAAELLHGLGFSDEEMQKPVAAFSGGWRMRMNLGRVLMSRSDILLLDEPTNHLDLEAILWLEKWLAKYPAAILLISHDRDFLDGVVTQIVNVENQTLNVYKGNYSTFEETRAQQLALQQASWKKQQAKIAHLTAFINRFKAKASKAKQAQSRMKMLDRMGQVAAVHGDALFQFAFREAENKSNPLLVIDHGQLAYEDNVILDNIHLSIPAGSRIGVLGPNGAGKTTLIKMLAGRIALSKGVYQPAAQLKINYFAQHQIDELILEDSPLQHLQRIDKNASEQALRDFLGKFAFLGDAALSPIHHFSGGEKARLAFALLAWQKPDLLLLDEPTNHLDMEMREALVVALQEYTGAMLVISHDRYLLRACVDEFWLVAEQKAQKFPGDLEDYRQWCATHDVTKKNAKSSKKVEGALENNAEYELNKEKRKLATRLQTIEKELAKLDEREKSCLEKLGQSDIYEEKNQAKLAQLTQEKNKIENSKNKLQEEWFEITGKLET